MMPSIDKLCERMRYWCDEGNLGYCQEHRQDIREGGEADCSSLVIHCLREAGFDTGSASYTGNMSSNLCARGWRRVANDGNPRRGDILLNDAHHVAVYVGGGLLSWYVGVPEYAAGERVERKGSLYRCLQTHQPRLGTEPEATASLWERIEG